MKVQFKIDVKESIKRGFDCQTTKVLEFDLSEFTDEERACFAERVQVLQGGEQLAYQPLISQPNFEGVLESVRESLKSVHKQKEMCNGILRKAQSKTETYTVYRYANYLEVAACKQDWHKFSEFVDVPVVDDVSNYVLEHGDAELVDTYNATKTKCEAERKRLIDECKARLQPKLDALIVQEKEEEQRQEAEKKALKEQGKAERQALYDRLPEVLRQKDKAGFASLSEIKEAMIELAKKDRGLHVIIPIRDDYSWESLDELTNEEFQILEFVRKHVECVPYLFKYYDENDDFDFSLRVLECQWYVGNLLVTVDIPFNQLELQQLKADTNLIYHGEEDHFLFQQNPNCF